MLRLSLWSMIAVGSLLFVGCKSSNAPTSESAQPAAPQPSAPAAADTSAQPFNMSSIFPPGPGRDKVLNSCGSCHSVACTAIGQRTKDRWDSIKESHKDRLTSYNSADVNAMFNYMKENFNDAKPEPKVPAELLAQGCTPF